MKKIIIAVMLIIALAVAAGCGSTQAQAKTWDISVQDADGNPIEGVKLQFCSGDVCKLAQTDANGTVDFNGEDESYDIHVLTAPAGYESSEETITAQKGVKTVITLNITEASVESNADSTGKETENTESTEPTKITFSSVDMNGNTVDDSIFAENKVTMVNLWEPWCSPCKNEMPDLEKLYQEYKDQGFAIIGIHEYEDDLENVVNTAGVTYPIVKTTDEFLNIVKTTEGYPTTFFVDSEGNIMSPTEEEIQQAIEEYADYIRGQITEYENGEYDAYKDDPQYADYFAQLEELSGNDDKIMEEARTEVMAEMESGYYVGSNSYDGWKQIIELKLASAK